MDRNEAWDIVIEDITKIETTYLEAAKKEKYKGMEDYWLKCAKPFTAALEALKALDD